MVGLEAVVQPYHEGVVQHRANIFLVLYQTLLLVFANELLQHHLHRVELTVSQTANKVHLAEPAYRQTFQHLVFLQPALSRKLYAVEGQLIGLESAFTD
jgi:hypothetical protein